MARIYLDARNITEDPSGVGRYALSLIPRLVEQAPEHDFVAIRHASNPEPIGVRGLRETFIDRPIDNLENYLFGAADLREAFDEFGEPDIYHDLFHILPRGLPDDLDIVVTLHDLVWIDHAEASQPTWLKALTIREFAKRAIPFALRRADHVISVSSPTADRASEWIDEECSTVISHGVDEAFFEEPPSPDPIVDYLLEDGSRYVVAVGNAKAYKNLQTLIRAFAEAFDDIEPAKLALIGNCRELKSVAREDGVEDHLVTPGFVDEVDLRRLLGHAHLFVFPSLVEGFGLPILEAMAMGIPTAVSDLEPMRSVGGDAALNFEPTDPVALAEVIRRVFDDDDLHETLARRARAHATEFRWDETARQTLEVYERTLRKS